MSKCQCDLRTKLVGDGCRYCNAQEYIDKLIEIIEEQRTWVGLTDEDVKRSYRLKCMEFGHWLDERTFLIACNWAEAKLKERNS